MSQNQLSQDQVNILYSSIIRTLPEFIRSLSNGSEDIPLWLKDSEEFWNKYSRGEISFQKTEGPYRIARLFKIVDEAFDHYRFVDMGDFNCLKEQFIDDFSIIDEGELRVLKTRWKNDCKSRIASIQNDPAKTRFLIQTQHEIEDFLKWLISFKGKDEKLSDLFKGNVEKAEKFRKFCKRFMKDGKWQLTPKETRHLIKALVNLEIISFSSNEQLYRILKKEFGYEGAKSGHLNINAGFEDLGLINEYERMLGTIK